MAMPKPKRSAAPRRAFVALAAAVFLWMLLLNCLTPYIADDFTFSYAFDSGLRLQSLPQLLQSLAFHYQEWTGRVVVKFFAQGFTMLPKLVFNLFNAAAYLGLGLVVYRLARGRRSGGYDLAAFALIQAALWLVSPAFGQTNLWMCGACNYMWASLGCLAYLLPWRYWLQKPFTAPRWMTGAMALGGLLAGWLSENTSAGMLVCLVLCLFWALRRQHRAPAWMWAGLAGALAGFALLILAPGNYNRTDAAVDTRPLLTQCAERLLRCVNMLRDYALPLILVFAVLYTLLWFQRQDKNNKKVDLFCPLVLLLGGVGANFAMLLSPVYYERSSHGVFTLLTAACAACLVQLDGKAMRRAAAAVAACAGVVCAFTMVDAGYDIASYYVMYTTRDTTIRAEAAALDKPLANTVTTYGIEPYTHWCAAYGLPDICENGDDAIALSSAKHYGVGALQAEEVRTYPFVGRTNAAYEAGLAGE